MEDKEIKAISDIISALEDLDSQTKERVFRYIIERFGINISVQVNTSSSINNPPREFSDNSGDQSPIPSSRVNFTDIRSLRDAKNPETAIQMAALVAFYLQELALGDEKKDSIDVNDIKKYFNQAGFPLPKIPKSALINTKSAGYFESADRGRYKLNPVGYNLVAYGLPAKSGSINEKRPRTQTKKKGKK